MLEQALPFLFLLAAAPYDVVLHEENLMVPMRDGVRLATDIYRPAREGKLVDEPLAIVLHRTPYDKKRPSAVASAEYFARQGYVSVVQDARGRYASAKARTVTTPLSISRPFPMGTGKSRCTGPPTRRTPKPMPPS